MLLLIFGNAGSSAPPFTTSGIPEIGAAKTMRIAGAKTMRIAAG